VSEEINLETSGEGDMKNITDNLNELLIATGLKIGLLTVFVPGSTAVLTTIEYEPGLIADFPSALERLIPKNIPYEHDKTWHDGNGHSHIKSSIIGPSITVPFNRSTLLLGTWQQIVMVEMDVRRRSRRLIVQIIGE
jgi:secondary thiamine-phosphate synthase enzyme